MESPVATVVGAAVVRHGCVLAARRTTPAAAAGRWELPGGKVEPGETLGAALVRELAEELGCRVEPVRWLDGAAPIGTTHELRVAVARLVAGEPCPTEHDRVAWLGPEELDDVDWLEPDRPFLAELRELLLDGEPMAGGNMGGAVRIGATVRRPVGRWTPGVHALLDHLEAAGLRAVPSVRGTDERGREVLDYLPGEVIDVDTELLSEARLADLAAWTREFHTALNGFEHPGPWRFPGPIRIGMIGHNDLAPYNACFDGDRVSGVFDWDLAGPTTPMMELAALAWTGVPLFRPLPDALAARRLEVLAEAYAGPLAVDVLRAVPARVQASVDGIVEATRRGDASMRTLAEVGEPRRTQRALAAFLRRQPALERALERILEP